MLPRNSTPSEVDGNLLILPGCMLLLQSAAPSGLSNYVMRAHGYVTLKPTVLDAQGQTIANALRRLHHPQVESVRQGKYFVLTLADSLQGEAARTEVERIATEVLTNPVIEEITYTLDA